MQLKVLGINFKTSSLELREKVSFTQPGISPAIQIIKEKTQDLDVFLLSTCNRTELYLAGQEITLSKEEIVQLLASCAKISLNESDMSHFYAKSGPDAIEHLMRVCASLDSMVVGETEILGQIKQAYSMAVETQPDCKYLHRLLQESIRTAKRVHTETSICHGRVSVSSIAVDFAQKVFDNLSEKTAMIVGAGETGELTLKSLVDHGIKNVMVVNRSVHKGDLLAKEYGGTSLSFYLLEENLALVDIVISSTSAPHCVIKAEAVKAAMETRHNRPILLIDIAVPRDIEPETANIDNVYLYDIDDLQKITDKNLAQRHLAVDATTEIVKAEAIALADLFADNSFPVLMKDLTEYIDNIKEEELKKTLSKEAFAELESHHHEELKDLVHRLSNRLMGPARKQLAESQKNGQWEQFAQSVRKLFNLKTHSK
jgi:glutamyl-tRNA reductase